MTPPAIIEVNRADLLLTEQVVFLVEVRMDQSEYTRILAKVASRLLGQVQHRCHDLGGARADGRDGFDSDRCQVTNQISNSPAGKSWRRLERACLFVQTGHKRADPFEVGWG
jgi:hypothetical protein